MLIKYMYEKIQFEIGNAITMQISTTNIVFCINGANAITIQSADIKLFKNMVYMTAPSLTTTNTTNLYVLCKSHVYNDDLTFKIMSYTGKQPTGNQFLSFDGVNPVWTHLTSSIFLDNSIPITKISKIGATTNQVLSFDGSNILWQNPSSGGTITIADNSIDLIKL